MVRAICETMATSFMEKEFPVCIDETNTRYDSIEKWVRLGNRYNYYKKLIFMDIPTEECKRRRQCKEGKFPEKTIDRMSRNLVILFTIKNLNILDEIIKVGEK